MSYFALALLLNAIVGFFGYALLVWNNSASNDAYPIVLGSIGFWVLIALLAYFTTGWSAAYAGIGGGFICFTMANPGDVLFTWGRALIKFANSPLIRPIAPIAAIPRFIGGKLKDAQAPIERLYRRWL